MSDYKPKLSVLGPFAHDTGTPVVAVARLLDALDPVNHGDVVGHRNPVGNNQHINLEGNNNGKRLGVKVIDENGELYVATGPGPTDVWKNHYAGAGLEPVTVALVGGGEIEVIPYVNKDITPVLPVGSFNVDEEFA